MALAEFSIWAKRKRGRQGKEEKSILSSALDEGESDGYTSGSTGNQERQVREETDAKTNEGEKKGGEQKHDSRWWRRRAEAGWRSNK